MSEPMDKREEEWTLPVDGEFEVIDGGLRKSVVPLEIHKAALAANREKDAEIERLKSYRSWDRIHELEAELSSLRASVGEKWIDVKQELPPYGMPVLVIYHGVVQHVTYARDIGEWVAYENGDSDHMPESFVTYWMPLPAPPTKDKE